MTSRSRNPMPSGAMELWDLRRRVERLERVQSRWVAALALAGVFGFLAGKLAGQTFTPAEQVAVAARDLATVDPARRSAVRYIAVANHSDPDAAVRLINFWLNSFSWSGKVEIMPTVDQAAVRVQFDLLPHIDPNQVDQNLQRFVAAWEWLARDSAYPESYFQVPTEIQDQRGESRIELVTGGWSGRTALEALKHDTQSVAPIVRFEWWHAHATSELGYYAFNFTQRTKGLKRLFADLGVDRDALQRLQARVGRNVLLRRLNGRPARMQREAAPLGAVWITFDLASDEINAVSSPSRFLDEFEYAGNEIIYRKPNGSHGFAIANAAGDLVTVVPDTIAKDSLGDGRLVVGRSCVTCHRDDGLHDFEENELPIRTDNPADAARFSRFYHGDIGRWLDRDRADYRQFVARATGGWTTELVASAVASEHRRYSTGWRLLDVARYAGVDEPRLRFAVAGSHDPMITALLMGKSVRVESLVASWPEICLDVLGEAP